jgi:Fic family protein
LHSKANFAEELNVGIYQSCFITTFDGITLLHKYLKRHKMYQVSRPITQHRLKYAKSMQDSRAYRGLAVTSRDDVIDGRPPYWRYFFRATRDVLMEITLENGRK